MKNRIVNLIVIFHSNSNESCKPLHLNNEIKHNLNVMVLMWCGMYSRRITVLKLIFSVFKSSCDHSVGKC